MKIANWKFKNFKSYGSIEQSIEFLEDKGELILMVGGNGNGKCVEKNTFIDIEIIDIEINDELIKFMETTDVGRTLFKYIKENNNLLYDKYTNFRKTQT